MQKIRITASSTLEELLEDDGYDPSHAPAVERAYDRGCLLWTNERLTTTDASRLDLRPGSPRA